MTRGSAEKKGRWQSILKVINEIEWEKEKAQEDVFWIFDVMSYPTKRGDKQPSVVLFILDFVSLGEREKEGKGRRASMVAHNHSAYVNKQKTMVARAGARELHFSVKPVCIFQSERGFSLACTSCGAVHPSPDLDTVLLSVCCRRF